MTSDPVNHPPHYTTDLLTVIRELTANGFDVKFRKVVRPHHDDVSLYVSRGYGADQYALAHTFNGFDMDECRTPASVVIANRMREMAARLEAASQ